MIILSSVCVCVYVCIAAYEKLREREIKNK